jgi:carboxylesterase
MPDKGVLLIHGFAGGRHEVSPLAEYLRDRGYDVVMPKLSGHEESRATLDQAKFSEWIASGVEAYEALAMRCDDITVIGFSMGGLIAVQIYQKYRLDRLVTINTPIYVWDLSRVAQNLRSNFKASARRYLSNGANISVTAAAQFLRLLFLTKPKFRAVECPCLIFQAEDDDTVNRRSADYILDSVCGDKRIVRLASGGHTVLLSDSIGRIAPCVLEFIEAGNVSTNPTPECVEVPDWACSEICNAHSL